MKNATFENDQFFILKKNDFGQALRQIQDITTKAQSENKSYEKVWIPENQVTGRVFKMDRDSFGAIEQIFNDSFLPVIEANTALENLELVAVRRNILGKDDMVNMHGDRLGYVLMVDVDISASSFEGGNVLFTKDDGEIVELKLGENDLLVAKCTNEHGVSRVTSGQRDSIAFFARPKI